MEEPNTQPTLEQRLTEIAKANNLTFRELRELVFQYQREENKNCKEENEKHELQQKNMATMLNGTRLDNERMRLMLENAELKPLYELLRKGKYPPKKKKLLIF